MFAQHSIEPELIVEVIANVVLVIVGVVGVIGSDIQIQKGIVPRIR